MKPNPRARTLPADTPPAPPATLVLFGASGDLARKLLIPALYNLASENALDHGFSVIGVDHVERSDWNFRAYLTDAMHALVADGDSEFGAATLDPAAWDWLADRVSYLTGDFEDPETCRRLGQCLAERETANGPANAVFYLATAPRFFGPIVERLADAGLTREADGAFRRIVVEKPFGTDLASARALNACLLRLVGESQIYRIDHFLGKETVQNMMVLRFANGLFEPIWNREHIDHVQITAAETIGVEQRGRFYDATGALRDMVPNHMFQLLAMTAMEAPNSFDADPVRTEKAKVIEAVRSWSHTEAITNAVRGQYDAGAVDGAPATPYPREPDVASDSETETYVALRLLIDNWRWAGVPFYVRTGKSLAVRRTEIAVQFKRAPHVLFRDMPGADAAPGFMIFRIQPNEGVSLRFAAKVPGHRIEIAEVAMDFRYTDYFEAEPRTGYETLIYDCLTGDPTLFQRADNIEAGWAAVQPFLDGWASSGSQVHRYPAGSGGPEAADELLMREGRQWLPLTS